MTTGSAVMDAALAECVRVLGAKGADYRAGSSDRLANFKAVAAATGVRADQVWFTYFYKHYAAVANYIKTGGQSESEPIEGRITDCINYLLLLAEMVAETKKLVDYPLMDDVLPPAIAEKAPPY